MMVSNKPWTWQLQGPDPVLLPPQPPPGLDLAWYGRRGPEPKGATMNQVHGTRVHRVHELGSYPECDALVTRTTGLALWIKTADCLPVVLWSPGVLGVAHAGWRGLSAGVLEAAAREMGGDPPHRAWIGPAIGPCCYEVGPEVAQYFPLNRHPGPKGKPHLDLPAEARRRLRALGVAAVQDASCCTRCHQHLLHSYRGAGSRAGRNLTRALLL